MFCVRIRFGVAGSSTPPPASLKMATVLLPGSLTNVPQLARDDSGRLNRFHGFNGTSHGNNPRTVGHTCCAAQVKQARTNSDEKKRYGSTKVDAEGAAITVKSLEHEYVSIHSGTVVANLRKVPM